MTQGTVNEHTLKGKYNEVFHGSVGTTKNIQTKIVMEEPDTSILQGKIHPLCLTGPGI